MKSMTPKDKAIELMQIVGIANEDGYGYNFNKAKTCALIAVAQVLEEMKIITDDQFYETHANEEKFNKRLRYWKQVQRIIKNYKL